MATISSTNAVFTLSISSLFTTPQQLQGFSADDIFDIDALESAEVVMGVDGILSGGFRYFEVKQSIYLQADSASNLIIDQWYAAQQKVADVYTATGNVTLISTGTKYNLIKGFLTSYKPIPDVKKKLEPRKYMITWNTITPQIISGAA